MIRARHNFLYISFFRFYTKWMMRRHFHNVILNGESIDRDLPVLMIGNHFSWWDGFIANFINFKSLHRKFHIMMLEDQLSGRMFLNKAGAYSIRKEGRAVMESLVYTTGLLNESGNLVVLYPQGEFESVYKLPVRFEKGISFIANRVETPFQLVFYVALIDYFSQRKPTLTIYYRDFPREIALNPVKLEKAYNGFLDDCIQKQVTV